jgi:CheY-like chemotaxis protein
VAVIGGATLGIEAPAPEVAAARGDASLPLRVLLAEDNRINQRVTLRLLHHLGYRADLVADGREVLQAVGRQAYDVVLMDIQMPELDGVEAAREVVRQRGADGLPRIIAMTANAMPGDRETYIAAGMDGYLAKPIELEDLATVLAQAALLVRDRQCGALVEAVDQGRLEHLRGLQDESQPSLVRELIDMFCMDAAGHVARLREAVDGNDADQLRGHAHRFLSATQNIGALRLSALCAEVEDLARSARLGAAGRLLDTLDDECGRVVAALGVLRLRY